MRAGVYTIHQSLTAEAAAVLKLALALASRRGHAQVTPLHVAFALLSSSCALQQPGGGRAALLRRACLRSHPASAMGAAQQHPLQCRALELCFNVALNRLSTSGPHSPPPSSSAGAPFASSLIQPSPTLSNALVAALKRAQANQRRGCVELQQPPPVTLQQQQQHQGALQQQQPLLAIKVELDQLIISILDDPSVSRVMREAGFSSATVKANLEEECALMCINSSSSSPPPPVIPPHFFLDHTSIGGNSGGFGMWPPQFLSAPPPYCNENDVRAVLEVMVRKQGRRTNPVVVGDSVSMAEAVAGELLRRLERGEVPEDLAGAHLLKLQLSYVHVRLMTRADVDAKAAELRRSVDAVQVQRGGLVVYVGDLRWALDEDPGADHTASSYSPVEHMVAELGRLLDDLRASGGRVWLVATASYQTYMRCQQRRGQPSLETSWALQAVAVPTGSGTGLALNNLHSSSSAPSATAMQQAMATRQQLAQSPLAMAAEPMALGGEQEDKLLLCSECNRNYEREASVVKPEADEEGPRLGLPAWLVLDNKPPVDHRMPRKDTSYLIELKRKWSRLCRKLHLWNSQQHDPYSASCFGSGLSASPSSWWPSSCLPPSSQGRPSIAGFLGLEGLMEHGRSSSRWSPPSPLPCPGLMEPECQDAKTTLALGTFPLSDTASSDGRARGSDDGLAHELERRLRKNIPWQPAGAVAEIVEAVAGGRSYGRKGVWLFMKGTDQAAQQRAAAVIAETCCGSADQIIAADPRKFSCAEDFCSDVVSRACKIGSNKFVLVIHDVEHAPRHIVECLVAASVRGSFKDHFGQELDLSESVVVVTTSEFANGAIDVISLRLRTSSSYGEAKRKEEIEPQSRECKRARHDAGGHGIDLNLCAGNDSDDDDGVPSDITHESDTKEHGRKHDLLESIATAILTLDKGADADQRAVAAIHAVLAGALGRELQLEDEAAKALTAASGYFLDEVLGRWAAEVFKPAAAAVEYGGKVVILGIGPGYGARVSGFMGSALPTRVLVD